MPKPPIKRPSKRPAVKKRAAAPVTRKAAKKAAPSRGGNLPEGMKSDPGEDDGGEGEALDTKTEAMDIYARLRKKWGTESLARPAKPMSLEEIMASGPMTIVLMGEQGSGKSCLPAYVDIPENTRRVYVNFDQTTKPALVQRYGEQILEDVEVIEMTEPVRNDAGEIIFPGFDLGRPQTAKAVAERTLLVLDELENDENVGLLVVDHFQALYEQVGAGVSRAANKLGPLDPIAMGHWSNRTSMMELIEQKIRRVVVPGGKVFITGYAPEIKAQYEEYYDARAKKDKTRVVSAYKSPTWLKDSIRRNWMVTLKSFSVDPNDEEAIGVAEDPEPVQYLVKVVKSKFTVFPIGMKVDVTDKHLGVFFDAIREKNKQKANKPKTRKAKVVDDEQEEEVVDDSEE